MVQQIRPLKITTRAKRDRLHGLKMIYQPKYLRFFQARFESQ
ncbi:MAG: hypothetical protein V7K94_28705 [Nostoc sp.]